MSQFALFISTEIQFRVVKWTDPPPAIFNPPLLGLRDPELPIQWKPGSFYFNPIFPPNLDLYIYRADNELVNTVNNKALVKKHYHELPYSRTWFEILPQPILWPDISRELKAMIKAIPENTAEIARGFLRDHSIRIPLELEFTDPNQWFVWLTSYQVPISPRLKVALHYKHCAITKTDEYLFLRGEEYQPAQTIRVRGYKVATIRRKVRQLLESSHHEVDIPLNIVSAGYPAIKEWILANRHRSVDPAGDPVTEEVIEETLIPEETTDIELALWVKGITGNWEPIVTPAHARTIHDVLNQILDEVG